MRSIPRKRFRRRVFSPRAQRRAAALGAGRGGDRHKPDGGTPALRQTAIKPHLRLAPPRRRLRKPTAGRRLCARRSAAAAPFSTYSAVFSFLVSSGRFMRTCFAAHFRANTPQHGVPSAARKALSPQSTPTAAARRLGIQRKNSIAKAAETQSRKRNRKTDMYIRASHYARTLLYFAKAFPVPCPRKRRFHLQTPCFPQKRSFSGCKCRAEASGGRNRREI